MKCSEDRKKQPGIFGRRNLRILAGCLMAWLCFAAAPAMARSYSWADAAEGDWQFNSLDDGTVRVVGYADEAYAGVLEIPEKLGGATVTAVSGVNYMENVTEIVLPETIRIIGDDAFAGNTNMQSINLPEGITSIGEFAFHTCRELHHIQLPETLVEIHYGAFCDSGLEEVAIPESVMLIDAAAFGNCGIRSVTFSHNGDMKMNGNPFYLNRVVSFNVPEDHAWLASYEGVLFDKKEKKLISYANGRRESAYKVPDGIRVIGEEAFEFGNLEKITLPDTLQTIEKDAFLCCRRLTGMIIPDSVKTIGESAFDNCEGMKAVYLGANVTSIGEYAFAWCDNLQAVVIGDALQEIGDAAFAGSHMLKCFVLSENHPYLMLIDDVLFTRAERKLLAYPSGIKETEYRVPEGTEIIGENAFAYAGNLIHVTVPGTVREIRRNAFYEMENLEEIELEEGVEFLGEYLFSRDAKLRLITIPKSVAVIHDLGFDEDEKSAVVVRVWHNTPGEDQSLIDGLRVEYMDEENEEGPDWLAQSSPDDGYWIRDDDEEEAIPDWLKQDEEGNQE